MMSAIFLFFFFFIFTFLFLSDFLALLKPPSVFFIICQKGFNGFAAEDFFFSFFKPPYVCVAMHNG